MSNTINSILQARGLLLRGLRVRIGNGFSTGIWDTPWLKDDGNFRVFTPRPPNSFYPKRVADLSDPITQSWGKQFIEDTFWPIDREQILATPIGAITSVDRLVWHYSKDGTYSVKSAYHLLVSARSSEDGATTGSASGESGVRWNEIWGLELPPKIRMFLWRVCKNILSHAVELTSVM